MKKSDIQILQILNNNQCTNELKSFSILKILSHTQYKYSKVSNDLNNLLSLELVSKGYKSERAETYYITQKGIIELEKLRRLCQ